MKLRDTVQAHVERVSKRQWGRMIAFDTETDGLHGPLVVASFADKADAWTEEPNLLYTGAFENTVLVGHHLAYDLRVLLREGHSLPPCVLFDTSVAQHLLDETEAFPDLGVLAQRYLGRKLGSWDAVKDDPTALRAYARADARATYDIARIQWGLLEHEGLLDYFFRVEMPLVPIIADMEHRGIAFDRAEVAHRLETGQAEGTYLAKELREILHDYDWSCRREGCVEGVYHYKRGDRTSTCGECGGSGLNPVVLTSGDSQRDILYNHLGLPELKRGKTKTGKLSTDKTTLPRLRSAAVTKGNERAVRYIDTFLRYRKVEKMSSTYYGPWLEQETDRLHPGFHQTGTVSGRWSSSRPNFQNVPPEARTCMVPDPGCSFISVDYTQIELYLLALLSGEQQIVTAYLAGHDLHQTTADAAGVPRSDGKTINFALVYGLSLDALAEKLNRPKAEAKAIFTRVHSQFPRLDAYKAEVISKAKRQGHVTTMLGRKRRLPDIHLTNPYLSGRAERQAVNHTIQGSAGDLIKCAMIKTVLSGLPVEPVLQIHDEVIWQCKKDEAGAFALVLRGLFQKACTKLVQPRAEAVVMADRWEAK